MDPQEQTVLPHEAIFANECARFGVSRRDIIGPARHKSTIEARWNIMERLSVELGWNNARISRAVHRHHTTVKNALEKRGVI